MKLEENMAYYTFPDLPFNPFQAENCGPLGMTMAAQALIDGKTVAFALCEPGPLEWTIKEIIRMEVPHNRRVVRYMGEGGPMGAGSHTVHGSGSIDIVGHYNDNDLPLLTACVCMAVIRTGMMAIRVREDI